MGGKQNILVMNDEAHHAYRIRRPEPKDDEDLFDDEEEAEEFFKEATVWVEGWTASTSCAASTSASTCRRRPTSSARVGQETNRPFPWVVSDFGLIDAIESGLVKIPQLAVRDTTGDGDPRLLQHLAVDLAEADRRPSAAGEGPTRSPKRS